MGKSYEAIAGEQLGEIRIRNSEEQMNTKCNMVIIKGKIKTSEIMSCVYNTDTQKWDVKFNKTETKFKCYKNNQEL